MTMNPAQGSGQVSVFKHASRNRMYPLGALSRGVNAHLGLCVQSPQLGLKMNPPPIQEKPAKSTKKAPPTKEELQKMTVRRVFVFFLLCACCTSGAITRQLTAASLFISFKGDVGERIHEQQKRRASRRRREGDEAAEAFPVRDAQQDGGLFSGSLRRGPRTHQHVDPHSVHGGHGHWRTPAAGVRLPPIYTASFIMYE